MHRLRSKNIIEKVAILGLVRTSHTVTEPDNQVLKTNSFV